MAATTLSRETFVAQASRYRWRAVVVAVVGTGLGLVAMAVLSATMGEERFELLVRDALAVARAGGDVDQLYVAWLSYLGILVWVFAAGAALLAGRVLPGPAGGTRLMLVTGGLLTVGLVADDLFELHERVVPYLTRFTEEHIQIGWALLVLAFAVVNLRALLASPYAPVMALGGGLLALSMGSDVVAGLGVVATLTQLLGGPAVLEEGVKLLGIACWSGFLWLESVRVIRQAVGDSRSDCHVTAA